MPAYGTSSWSAPTAALLVSLALSPPDVQLGLVPSAVLPYSLMSITPKLPESGPLHGGIVSTCAPGARS